MTPALALDAWLDDAWVRTACAAVAEARPYALDMAWGEAARRVGRTPLTCDAQLAQALVAGWQPARWSRDLAARVRLILAVPVDDQPAKLDRLAAASTVEELVALYHSLPLLPDGARFAARAAEGVRSNMLPVFQAVALDNPFAVAQLDDEAWSQMVLKAFFTASDVDRIHGLRSRLPPRLRSMLSDYAREREAAKRPIDPRVRELATHQVQE